MLSALLSKTNCRGWVEKNAYLWLRSLVIAGAILLSVALPLEASALHFALLLGLALALGMLVVFLRWPSLGLVALIGTIVIPLDGPSGSNATMALLALLLGVWLLDVLSRRKLGLLAARPTWPLLALLLAAGFAFGVGQLPWYTFAQPAPLGAQLGGLGIWALSAGAFLLVVHQAREIRWLEWMTWVFLALGGLYAFGWLSPEVSTLTGYLFRPVASGSLFFVWLVALSFSQAVFNRRLHPGWRFVFGGLALAILYIGVFPQRIWTSGWLPPLVAVAAMFWAARPRLGWLVVLVGLIGAATQSQELLGLMMSGDNAYSWMTRLEAWGILLEIVKVNPVTGLGPANYYWYTPLFPILGWSVQFNSHNQYLDLIAQTGLLGLACYLWFMLAVGRLAWRLRKRVAAGFERAYVYGAIGGLAGMLVAGALGDWVLPFFYNVGMSGFRASVLGWLFLGGLVALEHLSASQSTPAPTPATSSQ